MLKKVDNYLKFQIKIEYRDNIKYSDEEINRQVGKVTFFFHNFFIINFHRC